ncbi:hypothetical protein DYB37_010269 [Aphanomyces astaci]|uniref:HhH-GPD domain-containing protein n=1 Tax=Aphanomyces astaci TaxID=112090 RepID=A0A418DS84_APHAT|nr:hypothetical protein DYB35_007795 [Aphanomyces astaci]RHZ24617.1 hypothetical protein DYB37_010269 [Aphanomyces astaci]
MKHDHAWKATEVAAISAALLKWYDANRRCLPWRGDSLPYLVRVHERDAGYNAPNVVTPYATWVSEIMCQQTRVDTVVTYYTKWMDTFPTIQSLANADPDQVNAVWAGLGCVLHEHGLNLDIDPPCRYYRRARMLHQGAQFVMEKFNGDMPRDVDSLKTIPGIGPYTAGRLVEESDTIPDYSSRMVWAKADISNALNVLPDQLEALIVHRQDLGELVHVFSHVKHHMGVEEVQVALPDGASVPVESSTMRWMTCDDMAEVKPAMMYNIVG